MKLTSDHGCASSEGLCNSKGDFESPFLWASIRRLDPFAGSGTTLIAAEKTGRRARVIEFDPTYCDRIIQRFERLTGKKARLSMNGRSFEEIADERLVRSSNADLEEAA